MDLAIITFSAFACSAAMSIVAFMVGRCSRRLPVDGMLPRVVHSARFGQEKGGPPSMPEPEEPNWPHAD
jgi:hypothetical protein